MLLFQAIAKSGRKVKTVMVLVEARPRIIPEELINATSAVINAYLPGPCTLWRRECFLPPKAVLNHLFNSEWLVRTSDAGTPGAEGLFGKANPSGKLPFTYPRTTGDIHVPYWHWYSDVTTPLFPFGFGLSYTSTTVPVQLRFLNTPDRVMFVACVVCAQRSLMTTCACRTRTWRRASRSRSRFE